MEDYYIKNSVGQEKVFLKLKPTSNPHDDFTYEGTEIVAKNGEWAIVTHGLTYLDLRRMYEEGFHTIEKEEFERIEAFAHSSIGRD